MKPAMNPKSSRAAWRCALCLVLALYATASQAQPIDACDWEVAHPSDPDRVGPGVGSGQVDTDRAIAACEAAVERSPDTARFHYQLGRALVYRADRAGEDWAVGLGPVKRAATLEHRQAMFVLALLYKRQDRPCAGEPWTRRAADAGLKSARITYVNDVLSGVYAACPTKLTQDQLAAYLEEARAQVSGYYENMLLDTLERGLVEPQPGASS